MTFLYSESSKKEQENTIMTFLYLNLWPSYTPKLKERTGKCNADEFSIMQNGQNKLHITNMIDMNYHMFLRLKLSTSMRKESGKGRISWNIHVHEIVLYVLHRKEKLEEEHYAETSEQECPSKAGPLQK